MVDHAHEPRPFLCHENWFARGPSVCHVCCALQQTTGKRYESADRPSRKSAGPTSPRGSCQLLIVFAAATNDSRVGFGPASSSIWPIVSMPAYAAASSMSADAAGVSPWYLRILSPNVANAV